MTLNMSKPQRDDYNALVRQARHFLVTAMRYRMAGETVKARSLLTNGRKALAAAERMGA